jgi:hypothetical protein
MGLLAAGHQVFVPSSIFSAEAYLILVYGKIGNYTKYRIETHLFLNVSFDT